MGSFSIWHWLIVLAVVMLIFGTGKLRNVGGDLGNAVRGFKEGLGDTAGGEKNAAAEATPSIESKRIDGASKANAENAAFR